MLPRTGTLENCPMMRDVTRAKYYLLMHMVTVNNCFYVGAGSKLYDHDHNQPDIWKHETVGGELARSLPIRPLSDTDIRH